MNSHWGEYIFGMVFIMLLMFICSAITEYELENFYLVTNWLVMFI